MQPLRTLILPCLLALGGACLRAADPPAAPVRTVPPFPAQSEFTEAVQDSAAFQLTVADWALTLRTTVALFPEIVYAMNGTLPAAELSPQSVRALGHVMVHADLGDACALEIRRRLVEDWVAAGGDDTAAQAFLGDATERQAFLRRVAILRVSRTQDMEEERQSPAN